MKQYLLHPDADWLQALGAGAEGDAMALLGAAGGNAETEFADSTRHTPTPNPNTDRHSI